MGNAKVTMQSAIALILSFFLLTSCQDEELEESNLAKMRFYFPKGELIRKTELASNIRVVGRVDNGMIWIGFDSLRVDYGLPISFSIISYDLSSDESMGIFTLSNKGSKSFFYIFSYDEKDGGAKYSGMLTIDGKQAIVFPDGLMIWNKNTYIPKSRLSISSLGE